MIIWNLFGTYIGLLRFKGQGYKASGKTRMEVFSQLLALTTEDGIPSPFLPEVPAAA